MTRLSPRWQATAIKEVVSADVRTLVSSRYTRFKSNGLIESECPKGIALEGVKMSKRILFVMVAAIAWLLFPIDCSAQAHCPVQNTQFTPFQDTGHPTVQARCRCIRGGRVDGLWQFQFKNTGAQAADVDYFLTFGTREEGPTRLRLRPNSVSRLIQTSRTVSTCVFVEMFISVNDPPQPPPKSTGRAGTRSKP